jgi:hypothetical protein
LNGVGNELGVLLNYLLDLLFLEVFELVFFEVETELGATTESRVHGVGSDSESATGGGFPDILLVVIVFGDNLDTLGDEISGVETNTELTNLGYRDKNLAHVMLRVNLPWTRRRRR